MPRKCPYQSKAHQTVYEKGQAAARDGKPRRPPYIDSRAGKYGHIVTGARGYIRAWLAGFDSVIDEERIADR